MPGTEIELAIPTDLAKPDKVIDLPAPLEEGNKELVLASAVKTPESRKELICKDLLVGATLQQATAEAQNLYPQMLGNSPVFMNYGTDALKQVNALVDRILNEVEPIKIPELHALMKGLNLEMLAIKRKNDVSDPKVREKYENWANGVKGLFRRGQDFLTSMRSDIEDIEKQIDRVAAKLAEHEMDMTRNVAFYDVLYEQNEAEIANLIYVIGVMELVVEVAAADADSIQVGDSTVGDRGEERKQQRADLISNMRVKIGEYKGRLFIAWATAPHTRMMRNLDVGMASKVNQLIHVTIPTMKLTLAQWRMMSETMEAAKLAEAVQETANQWTQEFFKNTAVAAPAIARAIQAPTFTPETIGVVADSLAVAAAGVLEAFENGEEQRREVNYAMSAAQVQLADVHKQVDETIIDKVIDSVTEAPQIATSVPATPALTA